MEKYKAKKYVQPEEKLEEIKNPRRKEVFRRYFNLPPKLRETLLSTETAEKMFQAARKNSLNETQHCQASWAAGMIILGEINIVNFVKKLEEKSGLEKESARQLARDINQLIFLPVKEELKKIHHIEEWPREKEASPAPEKPAMPEPEPKKQKEAPSGNGRIVDLKNNIY